MPLLKARLQSFALVARELEKISNRNFKKNFKISRKFLTDSPLAPFLYDR